MPDVLAIPRLMSNGQNLTGFVDSVGTASVVYTYPKQQEMLAVSNIGNQALTVTVGGVTVTVQPGQTETTNVDFTSFSIASASGNQAFEATADEKGSFFDTDIGRYIQGLSLGGGGGGGSGSPGGMDTQESILDGGSVKGDGTTDDTAAINAKLAVANTGKKKMFFPAAIYRFTNSITTAGAKIYGSLFKSTWAGTRTGGRDVTISGDGTVLEDIIITSANSAEVMAIFSGGAQNIRLTRVKIVAGVGHALQIDSTIQNMLIENCDFSSNIYALLINNNSKGDTLRILNSRFYSRDADGIEVNNPSSTGAADYDGLRKVFIMGNVVTADNLGGTSPSSGFGIAVAKTHEVIIIGNIVDGARARGLHLEDAQWHVKVIGNIFKGCWLHGGWAMARPGAMPYVVTDNIFTKHPDATPYTGNGFWRTDNQYGSIDITLSNNYFKGFAVGMYLDGTATAEVSGCIIDDCAIGIQSGHGKITGTAKLLNVPTLLKLGPGAVVKSIQSLTPFTTLCEFMPDTGTPVKHKDGAIVEEVIAPSYPFPTAAGAHTVMNLFKLPFRFKAKVTATVRNIRNKFCYCSADVAWDGTTLTVTNVTNFSYDSNVVFDLTSGSPFTLNSGSIALTLYTASAQTVNNSNDDGSMPIIDWDFQGLYYTNAVLGADATPPAPTNLVATPASTQVTLTWDAVGGATSYIVKRSTTSGSGYTQVGTPSSNTFTDTGLTDGTTYYYVVASVNGSGPGSNSPQVSGNPAPPVGVPTTPGGVAATRWNGAVTLLWTPATNGPLTYSVKRGTASGGPYTTVAGGSNLTKLQFQDTTVTNGTTYYYVIVATNVNGDAVSTQVTATPVAGTDTFYDDTIRPDNATDPGLALGYVVNVANAWGIASNAIKQVNHTAVNDYCTWKQPQSIADCVVQATIISPANNQRLVFRRQDSANEWFLDIQSGVYQLCRRLTNTVTRPVLDAGPVATNDLIQARLNGSSIEIYVNGERRCGITDATHATKTEHGFCQGSVNAGGSWKQFKITSL